MSQFTYIVTCHNSEELIEKVLIGVILSARRNHRIVCVIDGCTDRTVEKVDHVIEMFPNADISMVATPDVHELLSINEGLRFIGAEHGDGYNIILQDDVILQSPDLEAQVEKLYATIPNLGYVSFRLGFNLDAEQLVSSSGFFNQHDEIESVYGAGVTLDGLLPGYFAWRTCPVKSPVCLPCKLVREIGMFNEELAPYAYDDLDLAIRATMAGYHNAVYSIPFESDVRWGGSRKPGHPDIMPVAKRNAAYIAAKYDKELRHIVKRGQLCAQQEIFQYSVATERAAIDRWQESKRVLQALNS